MTQSTDRPEIADTLAHDARNALNAVSLTVQLLERMIGREAMAEEPRRRMLDRIAAIGVEVEKVRSGVEQLRRLASPGDPRGAAAPPARERR